MIKLIYYKAIDNIQEIIDRVPKDIVIEKIYVVDSDPPETHILVNDKTTEEQKLIIDAEVKACDAKLPPTPAADTADVMTDEERKI